MKIARFVLQAAGEKEGLEIVKETAELEGYNYHNGCPDDDDYFDYRGISNVQHVWNEEHNVFWLSGCHDDLFSESFIGDTEPFANFKVDAICEHYGIALNVICIREEADESIVSETEYEFIIIQQGKVVAQKNWTSESANCESNLAFAKIMVGTENLLGVKG